MMYYFVCTVGGGQLLPGTLFKTKNPNLEDLEREGCECRALSETDFYLLHAIPREWFRKCIDNEIVAYYQENGEIKVGYVGERRYSILQVEHEKESESPLEFMSIMDFYKLCLEEFIDFERILDNRDFEVVINLYGEECYQDMRKLREKIKEEKSTPTSSPKKKSFLRSLFGKFFS